MFSSSLSSCIETTLPVNLQLTRDLSTVYTHDEGQNVDSQFLMITHRMKPHGIYMSKRCDWRFSQVSPLYIQLMILMELQAMLKTAKPLLKQLYDKSICKRVTCLDT